MNIQQILDELEKFAINTANLTFADQKTKIEIRDMLYLKMVDCLLYEGTEEEKRALKRYYKNLRKEVLGEEEKQSKHSKPGIMGMF